jgi:uncharacterized membrane protein YgdD (TMEM256/DUF423 family)
MSGSRWIALGAISAGLSVGAAAYGAHGLRSSLGTLENFDDLARTFASASEMHFGHSLALILVGVLVRQRPHIALQISGWCFVVGLVMFSIALYLRVLTNMPAWGHVAPFGGVSFMVGWLIMALSGLRPHSRPTASLSVTVERP